MLEKRPNSSLTNLVQVETTIKNKVKIIIASIVIVKIVIITITTIIIIIIMNTETVVLISYTQFYSFTLHISLCFFSLNFFKSLGTRSQNIFWFSKIV